MFWGNSKGGLKHIIEKRIIEHDDFNSIEDLVRKIDVTLLNGIDKVQGNDIVVEYKNNRVILSEKNDGFGGKKYVITSYDFKRSIDTKKRSNADATIIRQSIFGNENGTPVSQNTTSFGKDTTKFLHISNLSARQPCRKVSFIEHHVFCRIFLIHLKRKFIPTRY